MSSFQILSPAHGTTFSDGNVIGANGTHTLHVTDTVWAVLSDIFGHYYLQNPPVKLGADGNWRATNIHLGHDIVEIVFVKVTASGNAQFLEKVQNNDWGAFDTFPAGTEKLASVSIRA